MVPRRLVLLAVAITAALFAGSAVALLRELLYKPIYDQSHPNYRHYVEVLIGYGRSSITAERRTKITSTFQNSMTATGQRHVSLAAIQTRWRLWECAAPTSTKKTVYVSRKLARADFA